MAYLDVDSVPDVGVVELVGELGDLGDVVEPLDVKEEREKLPFVDRIEWKQNISLFSSFKRGSAAAATVRAGNSALHNGSILEVLCESWKVVHLRYFRT